MSATDHALSADRPRCAARSSAGGSLCGAHRSVGMRPVRPPGPAWPAPQRRPLTHSLTHLCAPCSTARSSCGMRAAIRPGGPLREAAPGPSAPRPPLPPRRRRPLPPSRPALTMEQRSADSGIWRRRPPRTLRSAAPRAWPPRAAPPRPAQAWQQSAEQGRAGSRNSGGGRGGDPGRVRRKKSPNRSGWKRPLRSPSPTVDPSPPRSLRTSLGRVVELTVISQSSVV